jgi:cytochrome oxidase Cu insertion factor (SCO1/SenC/PrrC family)
MQDMVAKPIRRRGLLRLLLAAAGVGLVARVAGALEIGEQAPDFTLPATTGEKISLSQFRGKKLVVVEFYVADFAPT